MIYATRSRESSTDDGLVKVDFDREGIPMVFFSEERFISLSLF